MTHKNPIEASENFLEEKFNQLKLKKKIDKEFLQDLEKILSIPAERIIEALRRGITKYILRPSNRIIWIVMGEHQPYLIYPDMYCGCLDYFNRVMQQKEIAYCKHLVAFKISAILESYAECELNDVEFNKILEDIKVKFD